MTRSAPDFSLPDAAAAIAAAIERALAARSRALVVWSGGSTPRQLVPFLATTALDWSRVSFLLSDERWVPLSDPHSNEGEMRRYIAGTPLQAATIIGLYTPGLDHLAGAQAAGQRIGELLAAPADISVLGIGDDGHTASLFPGQEWTETADGDWLFAAEHPRSGEPRISLTPSALWRSAHWLLLATTPGKRAQWNLARSGASPAQAPVAIGLDRRAPPVTIVGLQE